MRIRTAHRPVAILVNAHGDYLISLPAIRALARMFPGRLRLVSQRGERDRFFPSENLASIHEPDVAHDGRGYHFDAPALAAELGPTDLVLSLNPWHGPAVDELLERLAPEVSIGFHPAFTLPLPLEPDRHAADLAFEVPRAVDPSLVIHDFAEPPELRPACRLLADDVFEMARSLRVVAVHNETKPDKIWPAPRLQAVVERVLLRHRDVLVFDLATRSTLEPGPFASRIVPCGSLPLDAATAVVGRADLLLTADSCFLHAADLFRVPTIALFGPTSPAQFGLRFAPHRHLGGHGSMGDIGVDEVDAALRAWGF